LSFISLTSCKCQPLPHPNQQPIVKSCEPECGLMRDRPVLGIKPKWTSDLVCLLTRLTVDCTPFCRRKTFALLNDS
jgi:hypothetical protein